jgi:drug/metabolite transporter (DMT)-like permease
MEVNLNLVLLLAVALVWGTTFPLLKSVSADLNGLEISTLRFLLAALCMFPFLVNAPRRTWKDGAILGALALVSYVAQAYGLQHISSNRSAFLTSLNVLMVPFLGLLFGGRVSWLVVLAALLACSGIGLMSWEVGGNLAGDSATLVCALAYALYVIALSRCSNRHDARYLAATQIAVMAAVDAMAMLLQPIDTDALATLAIRVQPHIGTLLYLGVCATAGMLVLQAVAQRNVPAEKAAVIYAMEPVFAALFGWLWLNETLGMRGVAGGALVIAAIIMTEIKTYAKA